MTEEKERVQFSSLVIRNARVFLTSGKREERTTEAALESFFWANNENEVRQILIAAGGVSSQSTRGEETWKLHPSKFIYMQWPWWFCAVVSVLVAFLISCVLYLIFAFGPSGKLSGAVVAFDLEEGCPVGWTNVSEFEGVRFAGRTLVAAGPAIDRGIYKTQERSFDDQGGQEQVSLGTKQMPKHAHDHENSQVLDGGNWSLQEGSKTFNPNGGGRATSGYAGGDDNIDHGESYPHENMPPFIALNFCKKN